MEEQEKLTPDELFEREERCAKAIQTVAKAVLKRLAVAGILLWVILAVSREALVVGLVAFILAIDLTGLLPLAQELKKRLAEQRALRAMEP